MTGKEKCKLLKQIRREIAESNNIVYLTSECHYEGECAGTCPKCDAEIRYLDGEIKKKILAGEEVTLSGISLDSIAEENYTKIEETAVDGELDAGPLMGMEVCGPENFLDMTIEELDLSVRSYNCLKRSGRNTLRDILDTDLISMRKIRNLNMASIFEIYFKIKSMGYELFEDEAYEDMDKIVSSSILGLAIGDALGVPAEFASREELENAPVEKMEGFGTYPFPEGTWSDDTSMSLATLDSLTYGVDYEDMMTKFCEWRYEDKYTPSGECFDIGNTTEIALENYKKGNIRPLLCGCNDERSNGNGSLMRMLPVALYARYKMKDVTIADILEFVHNVSSLTHAHPRSKMACGIYVMILYCMIKFKTNLHISAIVKNTCEIYSQMSDFSDEVNHFSRICEPSFKDTPKNEIKSSGYVVDTLEAAIWCFENTDNFEDCVLKAVNLGEDTDTVAAVAGGLAGAYYKDIPTEFVNKLINVDYIRDLCDGFVEDRDEILIEGGIGSFADRIFDMSIEELDFEPHTYNPLKRKGINTVRDIVERTAHEIAVTPSLGATAFKEIEEKLYGLGLTFKDENDIEIDPEVDIKIGGLSFHKRPNVVQQNVYDMTIEELDFGTKTYRQLKLADIKNVFELQRLSEDELKQKVRFSSCIDEIKGKLKALGIELKNGTISEDNDE